MLLEIHQPVAKNATVPGNGNTTAAIIGDTISGVIVNAMADAPVNAVICLGNRTPIAVGHTILVLWDYNNC